MAGMLKISKILSANDTGETGGHQAGILIPKDSRILKFFPMLNKNEKNPRCHIQFEDIDGKKWELAFIYYNNALFGGTRNEYRLTRMTKYIKTNLLNSGDEIIFTHKTDGNYLINFRRKKDSNILEKGVLILGNEWKVIQI